MKVARVKRFMVPVIWVSGLAGFTFCASIADMNATVIPQRPSPLRVVVFIDGQNFYKDCEAMFGHGNVHPHLLGRELCGPQFGNDRHLEQVRFYTGIHSPNRQPGPHSAMQRRLAAMMSNGVWTFSHPLKYSRQWVKNRSGTPAFIEVDRGREKGVDVRIALDLARLARHGEYDVATIVSTDTDLDEAIRDVLALRVELGRWLAVENAVCVPEIDAALGKRPPFKRLRSAARLLPIDRALFDRVRDDTNYRP